jgi:hypothetical protein
MIRIGSEIIQLIPLIATRTIFIQKSETLVFAEHDNVVCVAFKNVGSDNATLNGAKLNSGDPMYTVGVAETSILISNFNLQFAGISASKVVEVVIASRIGFKEHRTNINIIEKA